MSIKQQEFKTLHDQYRSRLLNSMTAVVRNREEAEDITAAAFASAFKNRKTFRGESSLYTWLHAIAWNEARNQHRLNRAVSLESIDAAHAPEPAEPDLLVQTLEQSECCERVRAALRRVPLIYRRTLVDHFVRGVPVKQIARGARIPVGTVLSRIFTAKRLLREAWEI